LPVTRPNQVWAMDITYIPIVRGFVYLTAVVDWFSRKVLAWRLSITMDVAFCIEAVEEAMAHFGKPEIFNTDQGSQFTSREFTSLLIGAGKKRRLGVGFHEIRAVQIGVPDVPRDRQELAEGSLRSR
jgi:putative transposase